MRNNSNWEVGMTRHAYNEDTSEKNLDHWISLNNSFWLSNLNEINGGSNEKQ